LKITPVVFKDFAQLLVIWEASVRATHYFLTEDDIQVYKRLIGEKYLQELDLYCVNIAENVAGFIGLQGHLIQMLFVDPGFLRRGIGKALVEFAIQTHHASEVDVNEQNLEALKFYKSLGFQAFNRFQTDDAGKPFPILSLSLKI
jgi:putative acetyltransferase